MKLGRCARKGGLDRLKQRGLPASQDALRSLVPFLGDRVALLEHWDDIKLLTVVVDRLERWWAPGLLCIGDAAHAMSPVGGVGINLAVQDAVAAANLLFAPLRLGTVTGDDLQLVQQRREFPARVTQWLRCGSSRLRCLTSGRCAGWPRRPSASDSSSTSHRSIGGPRLARVSLPTHR
ncbi:MAG: hypothetical protein E6J91_16820 [Deltaproteobacteria bacterium]|nr:MAG: hypothetical protein E6J91_16820 [Deltaproteobacteria bacterium]